MDCEGIKYPIYVVSKGRPDTALTAKLFAKHGIQYKIVVEPQEASAYKNSLGSDSVLTLPFSNKGVGSFPARNWIWEHSKKQGHKRHWIYDDNIRRFRIFAKAKRPETDPIRAISSVEKLTDKYTNVAISGFNYQYFVTRQTKRPFTINTHVYSAMLIDNKIPFRWRLKYNEDVDLCLQALSNNYCTILVNAFLVDKVSTVTKMKGGNQTELYQDNKKERKVVKACSLQTIWPQYVNVVTRFNRPHHQIAWKKHFQQPLKKLV